MEKVDLMEKQSSDFGESFFTANNVSLQLRLKKARDIDLLFIANRLVFEKKWTLTHARNVTEEMVKFLVLCGENPQKSYGMCGIVDEAWHTFILFTKEYQKFCDIVCGHFIHHCPRVPDKINDFDNAGKRSDPNPYQMFVDDYISAFGCMPREDIWPLAAKGGKGNCAPDYDCNSCET